MYISAGLSADSYIGCTLAQCAKLVVSSLSAGQVAHLRPLAIGDFHLHLEGETHFFLGLLYALPVHPRWGSNRGSLCL